MSESGDFNKNTFLSRVFGMNSTYNPANSNPLLNDDNNDIQFSVHNLQNNFEDEDDDEQDHHDYNQTHRDDVMDIRYSKDSESFFKKYQTESQVESTLQLPAQQQQQQKSKYSKQSTVKKNKYPPHVSVNVHSENEDSSDDDEVDHSSSDEEGSSSHPSNLGSKSELLYNEKQKIKDELQRQYEDEAFDTVPQSLLLEGRLGSSPKRPTSSSNNNHTRLNTRSRLNNSTMASKTYDNPFMERISEAEKSLSPSIIQFGEAAKNFTSRTFNSIPRSIPKAISFQLPNNSSLPPPPLGSRKNQPHDIEMGPLDAPQEPRQFGNRLGSLSPMERALWIWSNVTNLDIFLEDVYAYYTGNGYNCILLDKTCDLLIVIFVVWLTSFMGNCIDYQSLMHTSVHKFSDVKIDQCYAQTSFTQKFFYFILLGLLLVRIKRYFELFRDMRDIKNFYNLLLGIQDKELQAVGWPYVVQKIMILRDKNINALVSNDNDMIDDLKSKKRLNAHDIANRLMRKENYLIAMFNKNVLTKALTVPIINSQFLTSTLEWNLKLCIFDFLFTENGQLKPAVVREHQRLTLSMELKSRFKKVGLISIFLTPFLVIYFLLYFFLKLFYDIKTNPAVMSSRDYSPIARWKLREFNELPHIFDRRLKRSREGASNYLNQFPREFTNILMNFISFLTGAIVTVLVILTVLDPENFLNFELTEGRTALFYMSTLGAVFTICKSSVSDDDYIFDPEASLRYVAQFTHYLPTSWDGRYHTEEVKNEFCGLFNLKIILVLREIASLVFLPYILYFQLPDSSDKIIDFFREFSVHVDGLGYVCTFAMFQFDDNKDKIKPTTVQGKASSQATQPPHDNLRSDYYSSNDDKMVKSYMYFLESYGNEQVSQRQPNLPNHKGASKFAAQMQQQQQQQQQPSKLNKSLYKSAILNNSVIDKKGVGASTTRYPPQFKRGALNNSMYFRGNNNVGNTAATGRQIMDETTAGLSNDTRFYMNNLNNSLLLGESFVGYPNYSNTAGNTGVNGYQDDDDDEDEDENNENGGVLGLINQIYKHKDGIK